MFCHKCGSEINQNQKFCGKCGAILRQDVQNEVIKNTSLNNSNQKLLTPLIIGISTFTVFIVLAVVIAIIHFSANSESTNNQVESNEQNSKIVASQNQQSTSAEKLYLIDEYQAKYFRIIRRNDALLQIYEDDDCEKDIKELNSLFEEVESKITNRYYLNKYYDIENSYSNNTGETTYDINEFKSKHYSAVDGLLNEVYKEVKNKISPEDFNNLIVSERKWLKDVQTYEKIFESKGFGSIGTMVYYDYQINMRNFRTLLLMLYL